MTEDKAPRIQTFLHGRCGTCEQSQAEAPTGVAVVYKWERWRGAVHRARCPKCGDRLAQTSLGNMTRDRVILETRPRFVGRRHPRGLRAVRNG